MQTMGETRQRQMYLQNALWVHVCFTNLCLYATLTTQTTCRYTGSKLPLINVRSGSFWLHILHTLNMLYAFSNFTIGTDLKSWPLGEETQNWPHISSFRVSPQANYVALLFRSSLQVCANNLENGRTNRLSVCKMHTLNCLGRSYNLTEDSACEWPTNTTSPCTDCQFWETCDGTTLV